MTKILANLEKMVAEILRRLPVRFILQYSIESTLNLLMFLKKLMASPAL
jgi:hypothetical protein